ncbi:radical SAM protein [Gordonia sp. NPDC057258]
MLDDRSLELIILPTEKCNFRCVYCYESFEQGRMSATTIKAVKNLISARLPHLSSLHIEWFGGEPLLATDIIKEIGAHALGLVDALPSNPHFSAGATTNGWLLTTEIADGLLETGGVIAYQVSLDGPSEAHDRSRILAGGSGTYHRIMDNLQAIRDSKLQVEVAIRVHVTSENFQHMPDWAAALLSEFGDDSRFKFNPQLVEPLGGPSDSELTFASVEDLAFVHKLFGVAAPDHVAPCYAASPTSFVIRSDGAICKCTVALNDPRNLVGQLKEDGRLEIAPESTAPWLRGLTSRNINELHCPFMDLPVRKSVVPLPMPEIRKGPLM